MDDLILRAALLDELSAPLRDVRAEIHDVADEVRKLGTAATGTAARTKTMGDAVESFDKRARSASSWTDKFESRLKSMAFSGIRTVVQWAERAVFALGALAAATGAYGLKLAVNNEQFKVGLKNMLGSEAAASSLYKTLQGFAARTPFTFEGLKPLTQQLIGAGFAANEIVPILTGLGDVVSGIGGDESTLSRVVLNLQQIQAAGRLDGRSMLDFARNGLPALEQLSNKLGMTKAAFTALMGTEGGSAELFKRLGGGAGIAEALGAGRFAGAMEEQSKTFGGIWSNIKDSFQSGLSDGVEGAFPALKPRLIAFGERLKPFMARFGANFGGALSAFLNGDRAGGSSLLAKAFSLPPSAAKMIEKVAKTIGDVIAAIRKDGPDIARMIGSVVMGVVSLVDLIVPLFIRWQGILARIFTPLFDGIAWVVDKVGGAVDWVMQKLDRLSSWQAPGWLSTLVGAATFGVVDLSGGGSGAKPASVAPSTVDIGNGLLGFPGAATAPIPATRTSTTTVGDFKVNIDGASPTAQQELLQVMNDWWAAKTVSERERSAA